MLSGVAEDHSIFGETIQGDESDPEREPLWQRVNDLADVVSPARTDFVRDQSCFGELLRRLLHVERRPVGHDEFLSYAAGGRQ